MSGPGARRLADFSLLIVVNTMWAAQYAAYKTATERMGPVTVSVWCFLLASAALAPFLKGAARPDSLTRVDARDFLLLASAGLVPSSACLAWGTTLSTASNASLIYLTVPIITCLMAAPLLGERMTALRWLSLAVSLGGVLMLSGGDLRQARLADARYLAGNALVLAACGSSAFYNTYSKQLLKRFAPVEVLVAGYLIAVAMSLPLMLTVERFRLADLARYGAAGWLSLAVLGLLSWGIAMVLWLRLLTRLDVSQASVSIYLLPFLGVLIAALTLGERVTLGTLLGGGITLAGTLLITVADKPREERSHAA